MGPSDHTSPPTEWCDWWDGEIRQLTPDIAYGWPGEGLTAAPDDPNPWFWHWCPTSGEAGRWTCAATSDHTLVDLDPLHLEPSLLWRCCGTHGFVRGGQWIGV